MMRPMLGSGMAGQAADKMTLYPQWQQEYIQAVSNGQDFPPFEEWMKMKQMQMAQGPQQPPGGLLK